MDTRSRHTLVKEYQSIRKSFIGSKSELTDIFDLTLYGHQRTMSEGHPFSRLGKTGEDIGGNFRTEKWVFPFPGNHPAAYNKAGPRSWTGPIWANAFPAIFRMEKPTPAQYESYGFGTHPDLLVSRGTTAIARTVPTNPTFSAAAALGELREGLPSLPGKTVLKAGAKPADLAGEYLNFEFGIKPMLSDAAKLVDAHKNADKILKQLYRDSGRLVRRKYSFPPEVTEEKSRATGVYPYSPGGIQSYHFSSGTRDTTVKTTRKYWFSGAYTYFFPKQEGWHRQVAELEKVYGIIPDINDLYQLTPWSWAVDWFSNTGDLVSNLNSFANDNLVLRYGYIMCHTTHEVTETWRGSIIDGGGYRACDVTSTWRYEEKQRLRATPYGFGLKDSALSPRQLAIISALGISRSGRR